MGDLPLPLATYRLQFHAGFTFESATAIVDYLHALGISHCYASSYFAAVPGSLHGYDVSDPTQLNPEIGDERTYSSWVHALQSHAMGHIIDLVPNHMGIARSANPWWQDVLENGPSSRYAFVFDIDWTPLKSSLQNKVLLPILGDSYGAVLERQEIQLEYHDGAFSVRYGEHLLPIAPGTYDRVLGTEADALLAAIGRDTQEGEEFLSILTAVRHLPDGHAQDPELVEERHREKEIIKRRLAALTERSSAVLDHVEGAVRLFNGVKGDARSYDRLDDLLSAQAYRLAYWRVAAEEINYRRFFDINELAAIRMEDPAVFELTHAFAFDLLRRGCVDGYRIDHVDGLYDPGDYLERLQSRARELRPGTTGSGRPAFIVVEKILGAGEPLPPWPVEGTTGYDFLVMLNGLFVDQRNERAVDDIYERFTRLRARYREIAYRGKEVVLRVSMASELNVLAHRLNRFSEQNRHYRDFTLNSLLQAMREIIACFPVYRTYVNDREPDISAQDQAYIDHAVTEAKRRNPGQPALVFDFVRDLLFKKADYISEDAHDEHMKFVGKFQQVTSPVTAKGIEDTALYIYNRLASLNEVGGEPDRFGTAPEKLHAWFADRAKRWPHGLSAASTHDTKRSEDVRARLNVLSELPGAWKQALSRWARANRRARSMIDGHSYPSRNEEYLLYQTLLGSWPLEPMDADRAREYRDRITAYMLKAMREAKMFTNWLSPSLRHERAMMRFVDMILAPDNSAFLDDFIAFEARIARYGIFNSLSQLAIKIGAPGIPDFYQGTEIWNFSLVDPDNRRPVDYAYRRALLDELDRSAGGDRAAFAASLMERPSDDRLKMYAATTLLRFRQKNAALFQNGSYDALAADGGRKDHVFGFARRYGSREALTLVPRLVATLLPDPDVPPLGERVWGDTVVAVPENGAVRYRDAFTGRCMTAGTDSGQRVLRAADVFERFPIALLESV